MNLNNSDKYYAKKKNANEPDPDELNVVDDSEDASNQSSHVIANDAGESREKYKKSILHRYLADSVEAVNTLNDSNATEDMPKEQGEEKRDISGSEDDSKIFLSDSSEFRKRKRSTSSESPGRKCIKTQNSTKNKTSTSRSLDSMNNSSNSNISTSTSSVYSRKKVQQGRSLLPLSNLR